MSQHPLNQAVIAQVLYELRIGQLRRSLAMGFSEEDLQALKNQDKVSLLVNTHVPWCEIKVNQTVLKRLLYQVNDSDQEIALIDMMLRLDASSKMISDVFGLNQREVALRRNLLALDKKHGRWPILTEAQEHDLWRQWKKMIDELALDTQHPLGMAKACMLLAQQNELPMASIWSAIEKWLEEGLI